MRHTRCNIFKYKKYSHFDSKKDIKHWLAYIREPKNICSHGFYPFIHFTMKKYTYRNGETKTKPREICYSSHIDRYIYEYYNYLLNESYNSYAKSNSINKCAVAYRNNLHQNNITIAKEVFNFIKSGDKYFVLISDFTSYFDKIDHKNLKNNLEMVLNVDRLSDDWYKIFKSVTKYSYIDLDAIAKFKKKTLREVRKGNRIVNAAELQELKKHLKKNRNAFGIPQGSSISSTLSNINLINYDKKLNDYVTSKNGLYRRYCDDLIVIIPEVFEKELLDKFQYLNSNTPGLDVNDDKMQMFYYSDHRIYHNNEYSKLKYLGFEFNGSNIKIKERTVTCFYLKAYRLIKGINKISERHKRNAYRRQFYKNFTHLGMKKTKKNQGNFLTYVDKCSNILSEPDIKKQLSHHWSRFSKRLVKITKAGM
jgi:hypothetical protein